MLDGGSGGCGTALLVDLFLEIYAERSGEI